MSVNFQMLGIYKRCTAPPLSILVPLVFARSIQSSASQSLFLKNIFRRRTKYSLSPPVAPKALGGSEEKGRQSSWHGYDRIDEYAWMQDPKFSNELASYLRAEKEYAQRAMKGTQKLQQQLSKAMSKATEVDKVPPPVETKSGNFIYYVRQDDDGSMKYCRRHASAPGSSNENSVLRYEQILMDSGELAKNTGYYLRNLLVSDDHRFIGCLAVHHNNPNADTESNCLLIYSLSSDGKATHIETLDSVFNFVFGPNCVLFYTVLNDKLRAYKVLAHQIGKPKSNDLGIYTEINKECFVDITRTKDKQFHIINSSTLDSSELRIFASNYDFWESNCKSKEKSDLMAKPLHLVRPRQKGVEYFIDHHDGEFIILANSPLNDNTDEKLTDPLPFRLMRAPTAYSSSKYWTELLRVANDECIEDVEIFKDFIMISIKRKGCPAVLIYDKQKHSFSELPLPYSSGCAVLPESNPQFDTTTLRLCFSSPVHLDSVAEYNMRSLQQTRSWTSTPLNIDPNQYTVQRCNAQNGNTDVPVTLIFHKGAQKTKRMPTLLRVYGAYGVSLEPEFRLEDIPLLLRGWAIALAHVRGGGELGRDWYSKGKGKNKVNSIEDFLACARFLLDKGWSSSESLAIAGVSAGGLVVGAALNIAPEYFRAATLHVPFVDPLSAMLNPDLPLTNVETAEWGNPLASSLDYATIRKYAPYDNINHMASAKRLPSILVTAGGQDKRVSIWQPAKWVARLRESSLFHQNAVYKENDIQHFPKLLFYPRMSEGHFHVNNNPSGSTSNDNSGFISAHAFRNAFLIREVDMARD
ncbi:hypothetical protein GGI25_004027 [Coemansia spiralis]|uniref:Prolyl endopeptidase n=2 Tax=Coemansia TaxID=4863 RepID=A0A9W8G136_9FUNG|nr:hypothetical protein EDC05_004262 [Coemansia umbellata]KAJ2623824.1 hypothetical protein GGI26_002062 [Coemansia sp. RSA 1358]KAJ2675289.1 hypothetical protein GGI25_004027 [Coemansia spiralis]